mmetsp:Transcript_15870/g.49971  ORF Transcript_15870/g.49971 Transcript_15870/m.49971 type:complete len:251 (+) Transcript_15870:154-906(+)
MARRSASARRCGRGIPSSRHGERQTLADVGAADRAHGMTISKRSSMWTRQMGQLATLASSLQGPQSARCLQGRHTVSAAPERQTAQEPCTCFGALVRPCRSSACSPPASPHPFARRRLRSSMFSCSSTLARPSRSSARKPKDSLCSCACKRARSSQFSCCKLLTCRMAFANACCSARCRLLTSMRAFLRACCSTCRPAGAAVPQTSMRSLFSACCSTCGPEGDAVLQDDGALASSNDDTGDVLPGLAPST